MEELQEEDHEPGNHDDAVDDEEKPVHLRERPRPVERKLRDHLNGGNECGRNRPEIADSQPLVKREAEGDRHHSGKPEGSCPDGEKQDEKEHGRSGNAKRQHLGGDLC